MARVLRGLVVALAIALAAMMAQSVASSSPYPPPIPPQGLEGSVIMEDAASLRFSDHILGIGALREGNRQQSPSVFLDRLPSEFHLWLVPGTYFVTAEAPGFLPAEAVVDVPPGVWATRNLTLRPAEPGRLRVVPVVAVAGGVVFLGMALLGLVSASGLHPMALAEMAWYAMLSLVGVALLRVGQRSWRRLDGQSVDWLAGPQDSPSRYTTPFPSPVA